MNARDDALQQFLETLRADMAHHETGADKARTTEGRIAHSGMTAGLHLAIIRTLQATGQDKQYVTALATQLQDRHPDLLATTEDDLALLRAQLALVAAFIHNPDYDDTTRRALAAALGLPGPAPEQL